MGERQLEAALEIFERASEPLLGRIETRQIYVDLRDYHVDDRFTKAGEQATCPSAYGYAFAGGSTEDGGGHFLFREGMTEQNFVLDLLIGWLTGAPKWTEHVRDCQRPKPILFETGSGKPPLQSQVRSVTLAVVGQLAILALPAEVTTMAGRRLRAAVMKELRGRVTHIVLAGYSNGYAGYVTTPEEYLVQHYEGGHTLHGRWTLPAFQQIVSGLASSINTGKVIVSNTAYDDWRGKSTEASLSAVKNTVLSKGVDYGDIFLKNKEERTTYKKSEIVEAEFWSHNPTDNYRAGNNFLQVEHKTKNGWKTIATDGDWNTTVRWRSEDDSMVATLSWHIPTDIKAGTYRVMHFGYDPKGIEFLGISRLINIK